MYSRPAPFRSTGRLAVALTVFSAGLLVVLAALARDTTPGARLSLLVPRPYVASADSDSTAAAAQDLAALADSSLADSSLADSAALDSTRGDTLQHVRRYLRDLHPDAPTASFFARPHAPLTPGLGRYWQREILYDDSLATYTAVERVGDHEVRYALTQDLAAYRRTRLARDLGHNWDELVTERERERAQQQRRGGLGVNIVVPGGRQSAFSTIFGKPQVDLRVHGQAQIRAGFNYQKSDQLAVASATGSASQIDPDFKQDLRLGITGTIGDKLRVNVNWDTNNQFDYQNQLKLQYTGYEDEIIQNIEAGNVFLQTPSTLIQGGQSLFGIKSEFQLGGVRLTTVASQEEGQSNSLSLEGGAQTTTFDLEPTGYDPDKHFFLSYYFRNRWEDAHRQPPDILVAHGFNKVEDVTVWRMQTTTGQEENPNVCQAVALVDLGEHGYDAILADGRTYDGQLLPNTTGDRYSDDMIATLRSGDTQPAEALNSGGVLKGHDFEVGLFKELNENEYEIDPVLGYISLSSPLSDGEALAVSYTYTAGGQSYTVGDLPQSGKCGQTQSADRMIVKLLRPANLSTSSAAAWWLEMRNIYQLPSRGISPNEFELQIDYDPPGQTPTERLPDVGGQQTLLQILQLDRLNVNGRREPDQKFDYNGRTINEGDGLLVFPVLEPFGNHLRAQLNTEALQERYVFDELYTEEKETAGRNARNNIYSIRGSYKGSKPSFYDLRAYAGLIEGSVRVTSGGTPLQEGTDYSVDYQSGTVTILNDAFLTAGRDIEISYEQNSFFNLQKKTLLGARADYELDDRLAVGATVMRLTQKSPVDKFRIGEEPVSNTIWGLDGAFQAEPRWLTRAVDALPLVQTRAPSSVKFTGEIAQLRPGHSETLAFERTRRQLQDDGRDFKPDELRGISYIDGFEGFENTFSLKQPSTWRLASPPDSIDHLTQRDHGVDTLTSWRASLGWYQINRNTIERFEGKPGYGSAATIPVPTKAVFPNRNTVNQTDKFIETLDLYLNPQERGPYNFNRDLPTFFQNPKKTWGGMMTRIPEGYNDFDTKNVEFVEFVFRPFAENQHNDAGEDARLYVDLGTISEDVLPNGQVNGEDGLSLTDIGETSVDDWSRRPLSIPNSALNIDDATGRTEDVGIDGLASDISFNNDPERYPPFATEAGHRPDFMAALQRDADAVNDPLYRAEIAKALYDPSGDDYHHYEEGYFDNPDYFPQRPGADRAGASVQQRFSRYFASTELNGFESQNRVASDPDNQVRRGNSRYPDSEDLNLNRSPDTENSYYQYELPLSRDRLDELASNDDPEDFVVGEISDESGQGTGWYLIRIPVQKPSRRVGDITDFNLIETMRMWTTGHQVPVTLRFATFELVGSQWRKSDAVAADLSDPLDVDTAGTRLTVSSINNEEDGGTYQIPFSAVRSQNRQATGGQAVEAREQAMVLRVEDLKAGQQRAASKTFRNQEGLNLLKYSNLRMFIHMHGRDDTNIPLDTYPEERQRDQVRLFVRLGSSETHDYYEYEQPLTPSPLASNLSPDEVWQTNQPYNGHVVDLNSMNIELAALNQLKFVRDNRERDGLARSDSLFWSDDADACVGSCVPGLSDDGTGFAPPGTRLGIKGNPSLNKINTIVVGVRNVTDRMDDPRTLNMVEVWVNELRVAGYDQTNGWAGLANLDLRLADLATVRGNFKHQTDGFGSLSSTLGDRKEVDLANWSVTTDLNVDKFIPERFGWSIPVNLQVRAQTQTPRFAPSRGDIKVNDIVDQIEEDESLEQSQRDSLVNETIEAAQRHSIDRSFSMSVQKSRSKSKLLRNTLDGLRVSYSFSDKDARDPQRQLDDRWDWRSAIDYRFSAKARTVRPFAFLDAVPVLNVLGGLDWNYVPQSLSMDATAARRFSQSQDRVSIDDELSPLPAHFVDPVNDLQTFDHDRGVQLQYNPFSFLNLNIGTDTQQSLNAVGVDTLYSIAATDSMDGTAIVHEGLTWQEAAQLRDELAADPANHIGEADIRRIERLDVLPVGSVMGRVFNGDEGLRTERYSQRFTASYRPKLDHIKWLDWLRLQDLTYNAQYNWQNGAVDRHSGANVSNSATYKTGVTLRAQAFWRKFDWYTSLEEEQKQAEQEAERRKREREQEAEREKKRREEERQREAEQAANPQEEEEVPGDEAPRDDEAPASIEGEAESKTDTEADEEVEEEKEGFKLPLPSGRSVLRRTILALTGIQDLTVTYSVNNSSQSTNVGRLVFEDGAIHDVVDGHSLLDAFRGDAPPLGYRFGFDRRIDQDFRVLDPSLGVKVSDNLRSGHRLQGRTSLQPTDQLQINLDWSAEWDETQSYSYSFNDEMTLFVDTTSGGSNQASVWAFGADYLDLVQRQLDTFYDDLSAEDPDADGRVVLTSESLVEDFRRAYTRGLGAVGSRRMMPFPMPSWTVTYSGLEKWPLLNKVAQRVTLRHGYNAVYSTDYRSNAGDPFASLTLGSNVFEYATPDLLTNAIRVNESFRPLVGVDISWKGQLQTNLQWSRSNAYQLSTTSRTVSANKTQEISATASYSRSGLKLPILPFEAKNTIRFSLTMAHATSDNRRFDLGSVLEEAGALDNPAAYELGEAIRGDKKVSVLTNTQRLTVAPQLSYTFSQRVSADFTLRYERFDSEDSKRPSSTNINGGVNVRVSISN